MRSMLSLPAVGHESQIEQQNYHLLAGPLEPLRRTGIGSFMQIKCGGRKNSVE